MTDYTLSRRESETDGIYQLSLAGTPYTAVLTYKKGEGGIIIAHHTGVPPQLGGRGLGSWLVAQLFMDAKREKFKVDPQCSFIAAKASRRPEWQALTVEG